MRQPSTFSNKDFEFMHLLLKNAKLHLKLVFGLRTTQPKVHYLEVFSFGKHIATCNELSLTHQQEEHAFAALEHSASYISVVQIHTVLEAVHPDPFNISEPEIAAAFQIFRLIRNAFAHNPFAPVWEIRNAWKNKVFTVPNIISIDTSDLDKKPVRREHYGGPLSILRFIKYADSVVNLRAKQINS
jgi:hypothetical protein